MSVNEYTNRELGILLENISQKMEDGFKGVHERQDIANGRTSKLEARMDQNDTWRNKMVGAMILSQVVGLPLMWWFLNK